MLDDLKVIAQRDPEDALGVAGYEYKQVRWNCVIENPAGPFEAANIVLGGMGGSALAGGIAKDWIDFSVPFEVVRRYNLPVYVGDKTLFIASSYSGNTEETLNALTEAEQRGSKIAIIAAGGKLLEIAKEKKYPYVALPAHLQPRMAVFDNLRALTALLEDFGQTTNKSGELTAVWSGSKTIPVLGGLTNRPAKITPSNWLKK